MVITTKLKSIRAKYRGAVDTGRRSGHGRVILLFFELCGQIWGGSPATTSMSSGIESTDIEVGSDKRTRVGSSPSGHESDGASVDGDAGTFD